MYTIDQLTELEEGWFFYDHAWHLLHHLIKNIKGESLLDVGCGTGMSLALIHGAKPSLALKGLEPSIDAQRVWDLRKLDVTVGSATSIPFDNSSFDTVISSHVVEHIEDDSLAVHEIVRVAKHRAIIVVPSGNVDEKNPGSPHLRYYNRINFKALITNSTSGLQSSVYCLPHHHMDNLVAVIDKLES